MDYPNPGPESVWNRATVDTAWECAECGRPTHDHWIVTGDVATDLCRDCLRKFVKAQGWTT